MRELMHREINVLKEILKVLLPEEVPEFRRRFFGFNIMSMVMYFSFSEPARRKFMAGKHLTPEQVNRLIRHITLFTLSGLKSAVDQLDENLEKYPMAQDRNCSDKLPGNDKGE